MIFFLILKITLHTILHRPNYDVLHFIKLLNIVEKLEVIKITLYIEAIAGRNKLGAHRFLLKAINNNVGPKVIIIDKSGANMEALKIYNKMRVKRLRIRPCKNLNNRVEGDHRFMEWPKVIRNMVGSRTGTLFPGNAPAIPSLR